MEVKIPQQEPEMMLNTFVEELLLRLLQNVRRQKSEAHAFDLEVTESQH